MLVYHFPRGVKLTEDLSFQRLIQKTLVNSSLVPLFDHTLVKGTFGNLRTQARFSKEVLFILRSMVDLSDCLCSRTIQYNISLSMDET